MKSIIPIAVKVRKQCEKFACSDYAKNYDFHNEKDLSCMCAVASCVLAKTLRRKGIKCKVISGMFCDATHCWVEIGHKIVDITATQFKVVPKVYIVNKNDSRYEVMRTVTNYDYFHDWINQKPSRTLIRKILKTA
jgi:hypothetical protein